MLIVGLVGLTFLVIFYLVFRIEGLKREVRVYKRELSNSNSQGKQLGELLLVSAEMTQTNLKQRLKKQPYPEQSKAFIITQFIVDGLHLFAADVLNRQTEAQDTVKKHLMASTEIPFDEFVEMLLRQGAVAKSAWGRNDLAGLLTLANELVNNLENVGRSVEDKAS